MNKKWVLPLILGMLFVLGSTVSAQDKTVITWWLEETPSAPCLVEVVTSTFVSETIEIQNELLPDNWWDVVRTSVNGGAGPDIVQSPGPSFAYEMAKAGLVLPLDGYVAELGWDEGMVEWALNLGIVDGQLYSLPSELETMLLYYNKTLFDANGWEVPATMDELVSLSQTIADAGYIPISAGNAEWRPANEWFVSAFLNAVAGPENVYAALTGEKSWADPEFVEAITILNQMQQNSWFSGGLDAYYTLTFDEFLTAFGTGEAAMNIEGSWRLEDLESVHFGPNGNEWGWAPVPSSSGEAIFPIGIGATYSINAFSEHPDEAAAVLTHLFSPETQGRISVECGLAPAPVRLSPDLLEGLDARNAAIYTAIGEASDAGNYGYLTWTFWPPRSDVYIYEEIELVWDNQITPEEYLAGLDEIFTEEFEAGDIPPIPAR